MKGIFTVLFLTSLLATHVAAQETVIWGSKIVDVSSEFSPLEYSAIQALHKPNVLPAGGESPNAWRAKNDNKQEFIMVSFEGPIRAKQVAIAESENPGAVSRVYAYDSQYNEYLLFELQPRALPIESRLLNLFFESTPYEIYAIKVFIDGEAVPGYNAIDAIGVSSSNIPINVLINLAAGVAQKAEAQRLGKNVNSQYVEHSPIISPDGQRLYFSRRYHPENVGGADDVEDIWISDLDPETGEWLPARNPGPPLNTEGPNFISSVTLVDGEEVLTLGNRYGKKGRMYAGVSISRMKGDKFVDPEPVEVTNDYNYSSKVDYFLASTGTAMIISAERDDTYGGRDLYVSFKQGKIWSEPKNLGNDINTATDDYAPFLGTDSKTLYYSTSGFSGYGGADIFVAIRLDDTWQNWSVPENLGASLNSKSDDQYFSIPTSGKRIYFSRGIIDEDTDIFSFQAEEIFIDKESKLMSSVAHLVTPEEPEYFATIYGKVLEDKTGQPIGGAGVMVERLPDGMDVGRISAETNGDYLVTVKGGARYGLLAKEEGYLSTGHNFDFNKLSKNDTINLDLYLSKIQTGVSIVLNNIFFDFDKAVLKTSSYPELNRVLELLYDGQIKKIEISGHTDAVGEDDYNQRLSQKRADAVFAFFRQSGIDTMQMEARGYGETQPKVANDTEDNRSKNRRVEFKILE